MYELWKSLLESALLNILIRLCECTGLTSVTFPEGLTSIGNKAFYNCSGLASVTFPEGYTELSSNDEFSADEGDY